MGAPVTSLRRRLLDWAATAALIVLPVLVLRASVRRNHPSSIDRAVLRVTAPLSAGVSWVVGKLGGVWTGYVGLVGTESENRELRADNERLRRELATASRRAHDATALEALVELKRRTEAETVGARVIAAPMSPFFRVQRVRIDRGERDVAPGMPVLSSSGLVGRISTVFGDYADVILLSDPGSSVDVVLPRTQSRGVLVGLGRVDSYACKIQWIEDAAPVAPLAPTAPSPTGGDPAAAAAASTVAVGDPVVTSGLGAAFPGGIVVGTVSAVGKGDGLFLDIEVTPAVDLARVGPILVLLAPPPPPDPRGKQGRRDPAAFGLRPL